MTDDLRLEKIKIALEKLAALAVECRCGAGGTTYGITQPDYPELDPRAKSVQHDSINSFVRNRADSKAFEWKREARDRAVDLEAIYRAVFCGLASVGVEADAVLDFLSEGLDNLAYTLSAQAERYRDPFSLLGEKKELSLKDRREILAECKGSGFSTGLFFRDRMRTLEKFLIAVYDARQTCGCNKKWSRLSLWDHYWHKFHRAIDSAFEGLNFIFRGSKK